MHHEVQTRVDRTVAEVDLTEASVERLHELWVLAADHERAGVRIS
jgi:hypothetical protein